MSNRTRQESLNVRPEVHQPGRGGKFVPEAGTGERSARNGLVVADWVLPAAIAMLLAFGRRPLLPFAEIYTAPERVLNGVIVVVAPVVALMRIKRTPGDRSRALLMFLLVFLASWVFIIVFESPAQFRPSRTETITVLLSLILPTRIGHSELRRVRHCVLILAGVFSVYVLLYAPSTLAAIRSGAVVSRLGDDISPANVIIFPRSLYVLVLTCLVSVVIEKRNWIRVYAGAGMIVPLLIGLATGGRGALVALVVAVMVFGLALGRNRLGFVGIAVVAGGLMYKVVLEYLPVLLAARVEARDAGRFDIWRQFIANHNVSLFGNGPQSEYPHNIFIELLYNYGVVGLLIFSVFLVACTLVVWRHYRRNDRDASSIWVLSLIALQMTAQQFSLDIFYGSLWAALALPLGYGWSGVHAAGKGMHYYDRRVINPAM